MLRLDIPPARADITGQSMCTPGHLHSVMPDVARLQVGLVSYPSEEGSFNKPFSNDTAQMIDVEVRKMVQSAYERTISLLTEKKALVTKLAETLLHKEVRAPGSASGTPQAAGSRQGTSCLCRLAPLLVKRWDTLLWRVRCQALNHCDHSITSAASVFSTRLQQVLLTVEGYLQHPVHGTGSLHLHL